MRRLRCALGLSAALAVAACGAGTPSSASPASGPAHTNVTSTGERCDELLAQYRAALAAGTGHCAADVDCVAYGGVDPEAVCGGATDADTAHELARIVDERASARCPVPGYSCPPIEPRCADGTCQP